MVDKKFIRSLHAFREKPTTGLEPVNLILTKDVLYQLSYMGGRNKTAGNETRTHNSHLGRVELYQLSYARILINWAGVGSNHRRRTPMDLQSIPFSHSGTYPINCQDHTAAVASFLEPMEGLKPPTIRLQIERSIN